MRDTIYRDEAVEICERWRQRAKKLHDRDGWYMADILLRFMKEMPSADRVQGKWIHNPNGIDRDFIWWKCSECGHVIYSESKHDREKFHAFCGRCGARMKGEVE